MRSKVFNWKPKTSPQYKVSEDWKTVSHKSTTYKEVLTMSTIMRTQYFSRWKILSFKKQKILFMDLFP